MRDEDLPDFDPRDPYGYREEDEQCLGDGPLDETPLDPAEELELAALVGAL